MKMSRETELGLIYIKRKILSHAFEVPISHAYEARVVNVGDIENVFEDIINGSETFVDGKFNYEMKRGIAELFKSITPEAVSAMNRK